MHIFHNTGPVLSQSHSVSALLANWIIICVVWALAHKLLRHISVVACYLVVVTVYDVITLAHAQRGYGSWVCMSVCVCVCVCVCPLLSISLLECLFLSQRIKST